MLQKDWFVTWFNSPYYQLLYKHRNSSEALAFTHKLANYLKPTVQSAMLDVACGTGRHSIALAEMGYDVTGIDLSFRAVNEALHFQKENLRFYQHDMRLPYRINYYDYVFNFFTSFGYFNTLRENDNAVRTMVQALKPGGKLIIDYLNVAHEQTDKESVESKSFDGVTFQLTKWQDDGHFYKKIEIEDLNKDKREAFTEKVAKYSIANFTEMFAKHKINIVNVFGDYELNPYDAINSTRIIMIAEKGGN